MKTKDLSILIIALNIFAIGCKKEEAISNTKNNTPPVANFAYSISGLFPARTVQFTNSSSNATSYTWEFGDNVTSNDQNPVHIYSTSGLFNVRLTAINDNGSNSLTRAITIQNEPDTIRINKIILNVFPTLDGTGVSWDFSSDPDIYFQITNSTGVVLYDGSSLVAYNLPSANLSYSYILPVPIMISDINQSYYV